MNEAELHWLMASHAPEVPLMLEDFLRRPDWHQRWRLALAWARRRTSRGPKADYEAVRAPFQGCPVRAERLEAALVDDSLVGLGGGTTEAERRGRVA
jgi:hypothetical protein